MVKVLVYLLVWLALPLCFWTHSANAAWFEKTEEIPPVTLVCFSGGREIIRKTVIDGPFADEYNFAHEVTVLDEKGKHQLNFSGGLCIIDRGPLSIGNYLKLTDRLSCYSGPEEVVAFEVYGDETTVDQYLEGRTFLAKARGTSINSDSPHLYLVFGGAACLGEETD